jgi:hypothetical protein
VELYTRWVLEESIERQFSAFASGFLQVRGVFFLFFSLQGTVYSHPEAGTGRTARYIPIAALGLVREEIMRNHLMVLLQVCGGPALSLFRFEELELLVCGLPHLDFAALQEVTKYDGGYAPTHPTILHLWEVGAMFTQCSFNLHSIFSQSLVHCVGLLVPGAPRLHHPPT